MTYDRNLYTILRRAKSEKGLKARELKKWWRARQTKFSPDDYHLTFTTNHDENSWRAADEECYGEAFQAMAVLTALLPGTPLIYGGQESIFKKKIKFFEKDEIEWGDYPLHDFYSKLLKLKQEHPALWSGISGGDLEWLDVDVNQNIVAFRRTKGDCSVSVFVNIRDTPFQNALVELPAWGWTIETNACTEIH
jgi:glycosidase